MCEWEEYIFNCRDEHSEFRKWSKCHRARNHPGGHCKSVKRVTRCWPQGRPCDRCCEARRRAWEWRAYLDGPGQAVLADPAQQEAAWQAFVQAAGLNEEQTAAVSEAVAQGHCQARASNTWWRWMQQYGQGKDETERAAAWRGFCTELGLNEAQAAAVWQDYVQAQGQEQGQ
ncbi:hypothetical protein C8A03DRAFT_12401 [Achaetomium macrosporum]|uniref:Uncharacterized protein n=1 Tax=Achaetomium macrosporum TaxID=79813 RepID=A0AAN7CFZ2_9PEZI|nr:hypothetical protein C8A03DRAFT_12401 [Achaetomium macrosporum]